MRHHTEHVLAAGALSSPLEKLLQNWLWAGKRGGRSWSCHSSEGKLDHLLNSVKVQGRGMFLPGGGHGLWSVLIKVQRTAHLRAASLNLGVFFCYTSEHTSWAAKGCTALGMTLECWSHWRFPLSEVKGTVEKQNFPPKKRKQPPMLLALLLQWKAWKPQLNAPPRSDTRKQIAWFLKQSRASLRLDSQLTTNESWQPHLVSKRGCPEG